MLNVDLFFGFRQKEVSQLAVGSFQSSVSSAECSMLNVDLFFGFRQKEVSQLAVGSRQ